MENRNRNKLDGTTIETLNIYPNQGFSLGVKGSLALLTAGIGIGCALMWLLTKKGQVLDEFQFGPVRMKTRNRNTNKAMSIIDKQKLYGFEKEKKSSAPEAERVSVYYVRDAMLPSYRKTRVRVSRCMITFAGATTIINKTHQSGKRFWTRGYFQFVRLCGGMYGLLRVSDRAKLTNYKIRRPRIEIVKKRKICLQSLKNGRCYGYLRRGDHIAVYDIDQDELLVRVLKSRMYRGLVGYLAARP